jgi:cell shape-determining protein MreC
VKEEDPSSTPIVLSVERPSTIISLEALVERLERLEREMERRKKEFQEFKAVIDEREKLKKEIDEIKDARWSERIKLVGIICGLIGALITLLLRFV